MKLPSHLFVSQTDGTLYDTRVDGWSARPPLRAIYSQSFRAITTTHEIKAALRAGQYTGLGGYQLYFVMSDGEALSFKAARAELRQILPAIRESLNDGWRIIACQVNYEDTDLICAHTNEPIPSAYGGAES